MLLERLHSIYVIAYHTNDAMPNTTKLGKLRKAYTEGSFNSMAMRHIFKMVHVRFQWASERHIKDIKSENSIKMTWTCLSPLAVFG